MFEQMFEQMRGGLMCRSFGSPVARQQWLDQEDTWLRDTVRTHGWAVQAIFAEGCWGPPGCDCGLPREVSPPFAYTVGLFGFGHPEIVVFGLPIDTAHTVLNDLGKRIRQGSAFDGDADVRVPGWSHRLRLVRFRDDADVPVLISAHRFYRATQAAPVPTLQAIWDDRDGRFPWEPGYSPSGGLQPMPGTFDAG